MIDERESGGPDDRLQQAVRPGKIVEIERSETRVAGVDAGLLPAEEQEDGPEDIEEERRSQQRGHGGARCEFFGGKADGEVTDEHFRRTNSPGTGLAAAIPYMEYTPSIELLHSML